MATCCVCEKNIGMFDGGDLSLWLKKGACSACRKNARILETSVSNLKEKTTAREYFQNYINQGALSNDVLDYLNYIMANEEDRDQVLIKQEEEKKKQKENLTNALNGILQTSGYNYEGYTITKYLKIISGETVLGTGFLSELEAGIYDFFGAGSDAFASKLEAAKGESLRRLLLSAHKEGANGIIGIDFDYIVFSNNMIGVVANGTAVTIQKNEATT